MTQEFLKTMILTCLSSILNVTSNDRSLFLFPFFFFLIRASGVKGGIKGETLDDDDNSDEGDDEDYTVYECHGLAPVRLH